MNTPYVVPTARFNKKTLGNNPLFFNKINNYRYFSGCDAELYFGDTYIDETVSFQYQLIENNMPLFGYNSYVYDEMAKGNRYVQGAFAINYTEEGYLLKVLNILSGGKVTSTNKFGENNHNPLYNTGFNILVSLGKGKQDWEASSILILEDVHITGNQLVISDDGSNIVDTYSFVARDLKTHNNYNQGTFKITPDSNPDDVHTENDSNDEVVINEMIYSETLKDGIKTGKYDLDISCKGTIQNIIILKPSLSIQKFNLINVASTKSNDIYVKEDYRVAMRFHYNETFDDTLPIDVMIKYTIDSEEKTTTIKTNVKIQIN